VHDQPKSAFTPAGTGGFGAGNDWEDDVPGFPDFKTGKRFSARMDVEPVAHTSNLKGLIELGRTYSYDIESTLLTAMEKRSHPVKRRMQAIRRQRSEELDERMQEEWGRERRKIMEEEEACRDHNQELMENRNWLEKGKRSLKEEVRHQLLCKKLEHNAESDSAREKLKCESRERLDEAWRNSSPNDYARISRECEHKSLGLDRKLEGKRKALEKHRDQTLMEFGDPPDDYQTAKGTITYQRGHGIDGRDFAADHDLRFLESDTDPEWSRSEWSGESEHVRDESSFRKGPRYGCQDEHSSGSKYADYEPKHGRRGRSRHRTTTTSIFEAPLTQRGGPRGGSSTQQRG
jgi:hypothetical protein